MDETYGGPTVGHVGFMWCGVVDDNVPFETLRDAKLSDGGELIGGAAVVYEHSRYKTGTRRNRRLVILKTMSHKGTPNYDTTFCFTGCGAL